MYRPLFTFPVLVATGVLILHSWLFRGPRNTLLFWGLGYLFAFARELAYQNIFPAYRFTGVDLQLFNVPLTVPMGWLFEAYTSLYLAQYILGADLRTAEAGETRITPHGYGKRVLPVIALACVITSTITFAIENVATRMHWWHSEVGGEGMNPGWILGHMFTVFWLLTLLIYITHRSLRLHRNLLYVALALGFMTVVESGGPAKQMYPWGYPVIAAYIGVLFLWRQLLVFFLVVIALNTIAMNGFPAVWSSLAARIDVAQTFVQLFWTMAVVLLYGVYLFWTQRPERPTIPVHLL